MILKSGACCKMSWMRLHSNNMLAWLQEVDRFNDLNNLLKKGGFKGVYKVYPRSKKSYNI